MASILDSIKSTFSRLTKPATPKMQSGLMTPYSPSTTTPYSSAGVVSGGTALQATRGPATVTQPSTFKTQPTPQVKQVATAPVVAPRPVVQQTPAFTQPQQTTPPAPQTQPRQSQRQEKPKTPEPSETVIAQQKAEEDYRKSLKISPEEMSTQADLDRLVEATQKGYTGIKDKVIPMEFITGQLASLESRALNLAQPLEQKLARLQAQRTASLESSKFALERADTALEEEKKREAELAKPVSIGDSLVKYNSATGTYESVYTAPKTGDGFTLSQGERRFDAAGNLIAEYNGGTGIGSDAQSWANLINTGKASISEVPSDIRTQVASALATAPTRGQTPAQQQSQRQATVAIENINKALELMGGDMFGSANGPWGRVIGKLLPGSEARDFSAAVDSVKALIGFDTLQKMREASPTGGALGSVTERELTFLQSVQGSLDEGQSTATLQNTLGKIKQSFERLRAISTFDLTPEQYAEQFPDATDNELMEYINQYDSQQVSMGDNVPQRNNNPGNVKAGGLADKYAIGTDEQGHLIFPDVETGFKALEEDIFAKLTGNSRMVPPNPTIAQIGQVYAEDPNWSASVAKLLGVNPNTPAAQVDFDSLIYAIAQQEGYYA